MRQVLLLYTKFIILTILCISPSYAQTSGLQNRLDKLLEDEFYQGATVGISVYDLTKGEFLYNRNEKRLCRPASNMKILTSATALQFLTPAYEFKTKLFYTGSIDSTGYLQGDIYLKSGFDPELSSSDLDTMMVLLKKSGIKTVNGMLYIDMSMADYIAWGKAWSWDDDLEAFQPYLSPIPINKGVAKLKVVPSSPNLPPIVKTDPESSFIHVDNYATTVWKSSEPTKKTLKFKRDCNGTYNRIEIFGTVAASAPPYETMISLQNPHIYISTLFSEKILDQFSGSQLVYGGLAPIPLKAYDAGYAKHTLPEVVRQLNKESDNLNAEMLLYALGYQQSEKPSSTEKGIEIVQQMISLAGMDPKKYQIVDGSGLSNQNYLSPELMVTVLRYIYASPNFELFKGSLPEAGIDGTLANRMKGTSAYRKVFAKTGSITGVSTLSGYVKTSNGHTLAFSIMIQNFVEKTSAVAGKYVDKLCDAMAK